MIFLKEFSFASRKNEIDYILSNTEKMLMTCYSDNVYPFKLFPEKGLRELEFAPITILYGSNGSGKSTALNIIAQKLGLRRNSLFNHTPFFEDYLCFCDYVTDLDGELPAESAMISSDDVFDKLINLRRANEKTDRRREVLFKEYKKGRESRFKLSSLSDYDELVENNDAKRMTKSEYVNKRLPSNIPSGSNGESAYEFFVNAIKDDALYLLDEPENSLSAPLQCELADYIADAARFFGCQFIISTHSPFLLSLEGAKIYDLDATPVTVKKWTELENIRLYHRLFEHYKDEF